MSPPPPPARRPRTRDREAYLEAARTVIARDGAWAARMADIAKEAHTTSPGLLYHFTSRQALLTEALAQKDDRWLAKFEHYSRSHDPVQQLGFALTALLNPPKDQRELWRRDWTVWFEAWTIALHDPVVAAACQTQESRWCDLFETMIVAGCELGKIDTQNIAPRAVAAELMALVDGLALRLLMPGTKLTHPLAARNAHRSCARLCSTG